MNLTMLKIRLKLLALKALPEVERHALEYLRANGEKLIGAEKRKLAVQYVVDQYGRSTRDVPGLNATEVDDGLVRMYAERYLDWAWAQIGGLINETSHTAPAVDASLPAGGAE